MEVNQVIKKAISQIEQKFGIPSDDILSKSRQKLIIQARRELCYFLRFSLALSYPEIGRSMSRWQLKVASGG